MSYTKCKQQKFNSKSIHALDQWSQTHAPRAGCGLREGPMRPANIRKNEDFQRNIGQMGLFSQKYFPFLNASFIKDLHDWKCEMNE